MQELKQNYIDEATQLLANLEKVLLELESSPDNTTYIQEIFRGMHTLKGVSGMYGFDHISDYTHDLETMYDLIRNGDLAINSRIIDITLASVDHIAKLLNDEEFTNPNNIKKQESLKELLQQLLKESGFSIPKRTHKLKKTLQVTPTRKKEIGIKTWYISFSPNDTYFFRSINLIHIFEDLSALGKYYIIHHESISEKEDEDGQQVYGIFLLTEKEYQDIEEVFMFISDDCKIVKLADKNLFEEGIVIESLNLQVPSIIDETQRLASLSSIDEPEIVPDKIIAETVEEDAQQVNDDNQVQAGPNQNVLNNETISNIRKQSSAKISVDSLKLDQLMHIVSELVVSKATLSEVIKSGDYEKLEEVEENFDKLIKNLRDNALNIRLVPVNELILKFRRLIRDLSQSLGKEISFLSYGTETELDKNIMDTLSEPILHIIRNCIDHGIEPPEERIRQGKPPEGVIKLSAYNSGSNVFIHIQDDGAGIDPDKILKKAIDKGFVSSNAVLSKKEIFDLIYLPGFSTAHVITEVSGRGVGMDIVKKRITEVRGEVEIESELGLGTSFTIKLHQTVSILETMMIKTANQHFLIPLSEVGRCVEENHYELFAKQNRMIQYNDHFVPLVSLRDILKINSEFPDREKVIFIHKNEVTFAIVTDDIIGEYQAVLKPMGYLFNNHPYFSGAGILGNGSAAIMIDTERLLV